MPKDIDICWKCFEKVLSKHINDDRRRYSSYCERPKQVPIHELETEFKRHYKLGLPPSGIKWTKAEGWILAYDSYMDCNYDLCPFELELMMKEKTSAK